MHDPSASQSLPRLDCLGGTFSPSRRQIRSTRLSLIVQPAWRSSSATLSDAARAPHRRDARKHAAALAPAQCRHGDARGLEVSPGGLLQNELVQRQIRDGLAQPAVLELKVLQTLHLLALQPTELLAPPIMRHLAHLDLADCDQQVLAQ